jgi:Ca-activated chloride channel homolog
MNDAAQIKNKGPLRSRQLQRGAALSIILALAACGKVHEAKRPAGEPSGSHQSSGSHQPTADWAMYQERPRGMAPPAGEPYGKPQARTEQKLKDSRELAPLEEQGSWDDQLAPPSSVEQEFNTEAYDHIVENRFVSARTSPLSTFSVDVDTASYSNVRRFLTQGQKPPAGAVRLEELINYFDYRYESPRGDAPFGVYTELSTAPWAGDHQLLHIGIQGERIALRDLPPRNLVFLIDVSGSMNEPTKLPLLKQSFGALLETMGEKDTVSMVVYAGASGMVLPPTNASQRSVIFGALERLEAGGSTNGGEGIELAYRAAEQSFRKGGVNRVILATDGDFNVGTTSQSELVKLIEKKRDSGVFLTVLGFGMGNYKDSTLEKLANKGNGNYAYIDSFAEARKVLVEEGGANMVTIAKDVKIQIEMNPRYVGAYRLIGYENRVLRNEDFNDDRKDAGEIGAGHTVTALYEILTPEQAERELSVDGLRYKQLEREAARKRRGDEGELAHIKIRYKAPQGNRSVLIERPVSAEVRTPSQTSEAFRFSAAVASFGMLLRDSEFKGNANYDRVRFLAQGAVGEDPNGHRSEFMQLVSQAARL